MDKQEFAVMRAEEAKRLLESTLFSQAFDDTRKAILEAWASLPTSDKENARDLHRMVMCLSKVRKCLEEHIASGKIAQKQIEAVARPNLLSRFK